MSTAEEAPRGREDLSILIEDVERLEEIFETWKDEARGAAAAYRVAIEALHGEALRRLVHELKSDPAALAAMKRAAADEVIYAVLRRHNILKPSLNERIANALETVRPMLASHGGDVELVRIAPPAVEVRFTGACDGCAASTLTFHSGVKKAVEEACPEITEIRQVNGLAKEAGGEGPRHVSPFALKARGGWRPAGALADIPDGGLRVMELAGESVLLHRRGATVFCFQNACAHLGVEIDAGDLHDGVITCPHHGFRYNLATGECLTAPEMKLQAHAARILGSRVEVRLAKPS